MADHAGALLASLSKANLLGPAGSAADIIPANFQPSTQLRISFGPEKPVSLGTFVRAGEAKPTPSVSFSALQDGGAGGGDDKTYLFMMIDPDAPTPAEPKFAYWRHYVVSGLRPGGDGEGRTLTEYLAPGPGEQSGPHRYLFLLFEEPAGGLGGLTKEDVGGEEFVQRRSFKAADFVARHGLKLAGVEWMTCAWDGYKHAE
ncbi:phosphatidylethanolamine-binding protein [Microdochium bolleyi]|uniref:Phosphatidylethanolamine-binding protein n=1 Tax=Microdochium bolleyi TaxID=196109 RepID=A0A136JCH8_9PEZI|nr:phosphatidylethanolamine-binding protein [Microdochium bolleyi]